MLGIVSLYGPSRLWATNPAEISHPWRLVALGTFLWMAAVAATAPLWQWMGVRHATYLGFVTTLVFTHGGWLTSRLGLALGLLAAVGLIAVTAAIIVRLGNLRARDSVMTWAALFLALSPPAQAVVGSAGGVAAGGVAVEEVSVQLVDKPDIFVVVLDGYAGQTALRREFGFGNEQLLDRLNVAGFATPTAWTSYTHTHLSVPSLLNMSYPMSDGALVGAEGGRALRDAIGGENQLVHLLKSRGYRFTMIEAGWGGSRCGAQVDQCVQAPFVDDGVFAYLGSTLLGPLVTGAFGHAFTQGAIHSMQWLIDQSAGLGRNGLADLVFGHVLAPHPPYYLDDECALRVDSRYRVVALAGVAETDTSDRERNDAYVAQLLCVNRFVEEFISTVDVEATVVLVGDHGSDRREQLGRDPSLWTSADRLERMNAFLAVRTRAKCDLGEPVLLPNVMRRVLGCLSGEAVPDVRPRMFYVTEPIREFSSLEVDELLGG